jgi:PilZ domain-containing protein
MLAAKFRDSARRGLNQTAWIHCGDNAALRECMLHNISEQGAGIILASDETMPVEFFLLFSPSGRPGRHCRLAWQDGNKIGCEFKDAG